MLSNLVLRFIYIRFHLRGLVDVQSFVRREFRELSKYLYLL